MSAELTQYFATCPKGLEGLLYDELLALGAESTRETVAGCYFYSKVSTAYRACMWSRLANRILLPLNSFEVNSAEELYEGISAIPWTEYWSGKGTLAVDFTGRNDAIRHTQFGAQKTKDAVVDYYRGKGIDRPSVDKIRPDIRINVHLHHGKATAALDFGGESLHRRGYRTEQGIAPLKENLAAAILLRADWPGVAARGGALIDPMCGAGTLLIEGVMMAAEIAPGLTRQRYGFEAWEQHKPSTWKQIRKEAEAKADAGRARYLPNFEGYDADPRVIRSARANIERAGLTKQIKVERRAMSDFARSSERDHDFGLLICNPPYGERIGEEESLRPLYKQIGNKLKEECAGWHAAIFTGNVGLGKTMGLRSHRQYAFLNGALACKLLLFKVEESQYVKSPGAAGGATEYTERDGFDIGIDQLIYPKNESEFTSGEQMFANRLKKNIKHLKKWVKREELQCYRIYDADMPEYAVAIDRYNECLHVSEYRAPIGIAPEDAERRLNEVKRVLPLVFDIEPTEIFLKQRQRQRGTWQYERQGNDSRHLVVIEGAARLKVNLSDYLDTGLFLDHRPLRQRIASESKGKSFLNLFCYTASVTVHAALGHAKSSVSVDMSKVYLAWAEENLRLNNIDQEAHQLVAGNCLEWIKSCTTQFDIILLDPPSFSNSKRMEGVLDIQRDYLELIESCSKLLTADGSLYFSNNLKRFKMDSSKLPHLRVEDISESTIDIDFRRNGKIHRCWLIRNS